jgi:hypothetical protein
MRIAFVAVVGLGLAGAVPGGVASAAVLIDPLAGDVAAPASAACAASGGFACPPAATPELSSKTDTVPPAAVAGIVGLLALALAFRPRKATRKMGLPEVTS